MIPAPILLRESCINDILPCDIRVRQLANRILNNLTSRHSCRHYTLGDRLNIMVPRPTRWYRLSDAPASMGVNAVQC